MQFVDEASFQVLPNRRRAAADADIAIAGRLTGTLERVVNAAGHEMKRRTAFHLERRTPVMRQHEHRHVIRWFVTPPAFPIVVRPWTAHRAEHVAAENPRAEV